MHWVSSRRRNNPEPCCSRPTTRLMQAESPSCRRDIRLGTLTASGLVECCLDRIEAIDPMVQVALHRPRQRARQPRSQRSKPVRTPQALAARSVTVRVMMVVRSRALLAAIFRACPRPFLAFVGAIPRPVEGRRRGSARSDAVTCLCDGRDRRQAQGGGKSDPSDCLQHDFLSLAASSRRPNDTSFNAVAWS
jgi:hypothetical protein